MSISEKLRVALEITPVLGRDFAAVELALTYAGQLDRLIVRLGEDDAIESATHHKRVITEIDIVGRRFEAMLDRLGMSPGARRAAPPANGQPGVTPAEAALAALRADAEAGYSTAGIDYASAVDPSVVDADREVPV